MADATTYFRLVANNTVVATIYHPYVKNSNTASRPDGGTTYYAYYFSNIGWTPQYSSGTAGGTVFLEDNANVYVFSTSAAALDAAQAGDYSTGVFTNVRIVAMLHCVLYIPKRGSYNKIGMDNGGNGQVYAEYTDWDGTVKTSTILNQLDSNSYIDVYSKLVNDSTKAKLYAVPDDNTNFVGWTTDLSVLPSTPVNNPQLAHSQVRYYAIFINTSTYLTLYFWHLTLSDTWVIFSLVYETTFPWYSPVEGFFDLRNGMHYNRSPRALPPASDDRVTITPVYDEIYGDLVGFNWRLMLENEVRLTRTLEKATPDIDPLRTVTFVAGAANYKAILRVRARYRLIMDGYTGPLGNDYVGDGFQIEYASQKTVWCQITGTLPGYEFDKVTRVDGETVITVSTERDFVLGLLEQDATLTIHMRESENNVPDIKVSDKYVYVPGNQAEAVGNTFTLSHGDSPVPDDAGAYYVGYNFIITPDPAVGWDAKRVVVKRDGLPDVVVEKVSGETDITVTHAALDAVYVLVFERLKYTVSVVSQYESHLDASVSRGTSYGKSITVSHGDTVIFDANLKVRTPANTYFFGGWFREDVIFVSSSPRYSEIITGPTVLRAKLQIKTTVASFDVEKGTVSVDGLDVQGKRLEDDEITIEATPEAEHTFVGWYNAANLKYPTYTQSWTGTPGVAHTFKANFVLTALLGTRVFAVRNYDTTLGHAPTTGIIAIGDTDAVEISEKDYYDLLPVDLDEGYTPSEVIPPPGYPGDRYYRFDESFLGNVTLTPNSDAPMFAVNIRRGSIDLDDPDPVFVWDDMEPYTDEPEFPIYEVEYFELYVMWGYAVPLTVNVAYSDDSNSNMGEISVSDNPLVVSVATSAVIYTGGLAYLTAVPKPGWRFKHWALASDGTGAVATPYRVYNSLTLYAVFEMDTHQLYMFDRGATKMLGTWESKAYDANLPVDMSSARIDSDSYKEPIQLFSKSGESPDLVKDTGQNISVTSQDPRRLPKSRPVRYHSVMVKFYSKIRRLSVSTSMGGLRG